MKKFFRGLGYVFTLKVPLFQWIQQWKCPIEEAMHEHWCSHLRGELLRGLQRRIGSFSAALAC